MPRLLEKEPQAAGPLEFELMQELTEQEVIVAF